MLALCRGSRARGYGRGVNSFLFLIADHEALLGESAVSSVRQWMYCILDLWEGAIVTARIGGSGMISKVKKFITVY